jgi:hypothetical protein
MTVPTSARHSYVELDGITWEYANLDLPGRCEQFGWCGANCGPLPTGALGDSHSRHIASALRGSDLVEIAVGQWKANPKMGVRDTGSCFGINRDRAPRVGIFTCPADLAESKRAFLSVAEADGLAQALRLVGADQFADAMAAAVTFAQGLTAGSPEVKR